MPKKNSPVQRSLSHLRENGWTCCIVEKFLPARGTMKFPRRIDAYGIGDILACRPAMDGHIAAIALVQSCSTDFAKHKAKIVAIPEFWIWKKAGGRVFLQSWIRKGKDVRGYKLREEEL